MMILKSVKSKKYLMHYEIKKYLDDAYKVAILISLPLAIIGVFIMSYPRWFAALDYGLSIGLIIYASIIHPRIKKGNTKAGFKVTYEGKMLAPVLITGYAVSALPRFALTLLFDVLYLKDSLETMSLLESKYFKNIIGSFFNPFFTIGILLIGFVIYQVYFNKSEVTVKEYTSLLREKFAKSGNRLSEEGCYKHFVRDIIHKDIMKPAPVQKEQIPQKFDTNKENPKEKPPLLIKTERRRNRDIKERTSGE